MSERTWMIYGANGYTGALIAKAAQATGHTPVLAGRHGDRIRAVAEPLNLPWTSFPLDDPPSVAEAIRDCQLVLHCAGPFSATSRPMVDACLKAGTHYLDITGEASVFEAAYARHDEARKRGIALIPGVGADIVPSNCLAAMLTERLPHADTLELAMAYATTPSHGTLKSAIEQLPKGGLVVQKGQVQRVPYGSPMREVPFPDKTRTVMAAPYGDLIGAHRVSGIPTITVYMAMPSWMLTLTRLFGQFAGITGKPWVQKLLKDRIDKMVDANAQDRTGGWLCWWGDVRRGSEHVTGVARAGEPYAFTVIAALAAAERVLAGNVAPGSWSPAQAFGKDFFSSLEGCELHLQGP